MVSPVFTGAVALLALNDHALKPRHPGLLTGKLSDVAGVVIVAVAIVATTRRPTVAAATTSVLFAALKLSAVAASVAAPVLGGVTRTDPTDLMALVVLVPLHPWMQRTVSDATRRTPLRPVDAAMAVLAVLVCTATSCDEPHGIDRVVVAGDALWAGYGETRTLTNGRDASEQVVQEWAVSSDGGRTWTATNDQPVGGIAGAVEQCGESGRCWRVIPGERVEMQDGAGWVTAYEFTTEQWRRMKLRAGRDCGDPDPRAGAFGELLVTDRGDEETVLVTMGSQGALRWSGGEWTRLGILGRDPVSMSGPSWLAKLDVWSIVALAASAPVLLLVGAGRRTRSRRRFAAAAGVVLLAAPVLAAIVLFTHWDYAVEGVVIAGVAVGVFLASLLTALASDGKALDGRPPGRDIAEP